MAPTMPGTAITTNDKCLRYRSYSSSYNACCNEHNGITYWDGIYSYYNSY